MGDNTDNFGGTTVTGENGEQMDPAVAGISPPELPTIGGDAAVLAIGAHIEDNTAGEAETAALDDESGEAMADKADLIEADSILDPEPKAPGDEDEADVTASGAE